MQAVLVNPVFTNGNATRLISGSELLARLCHSPFPERRQRTHIGWLHIPKTGTSFMNTIVHWACDDNIPATLSIADMVRREEELEAQHPGSPIFTNAWAQLDREYNVSASCFAPHGRLVDRGRRIGSGWRTHIPAVNAAEVPHLVTLMRRPMQRLSSAFYHKGGPHGIPPMDRPHLTNIQDFMRYCPSHNGAIKSQTTHCTANSQCTGTAPNPEMQCAANKQCSYILGRPCTEAAHVRDAVRRLRSLAFTGLTEWWNESVCLFHRVLGGSPRVVEFESSRAATTGIKSASGWYNEVSLLPAGGCGATAASPMCDQAEIMDAVLYAFAMQRFLRQIQDVTGWACAFTDTAVDPARDSNAARSLPDGSIEALPGLRIPTFLLQPTTGPPKLVCADSTELKR